MESSPSKRRKTSPTTSVPGDAPATPSRIPIRQDSAKTTPGKRPSFASPTKASIAKHNPQLLARPSSVRKDAPRSGSRGRNLDDVFARALTQVRPSIEGQDDGTDLSTTQENEVLDEEFPATQGQKETRSIGGGLSAKPRRISRSPLKQPPTNYEPTDGEGELQENPNPFKKTGLRRSPISSQPEPVLQENLNPFQKRGLRRSPVSSQPLNTLRQGSDTRELAIPTNDFPPQTVDAAFRKDPTPLEDIGVDQDEQTMFSKPGQNVGEPANGPQFLSSRTSPVNINQHSLLPAIALQSQARLNHHNEPELPPTPVALGIPDPIVTTPPTGIHDTPSKRARRKKSSTKKIKSSPLKPKDPPPPEPVHEFQAEVQKEETIKQGRRKSARFLVPEDPHAAKKKELDDLLKELQQLRTDISVANQENERLRLHSEQKRSPPSGAKNADLLAVLLRSTAPEPSSKPAPKSSIFKSIGSFLPFSSRLKARSTIFLDKPIPSHLPVAVDNPLPYLQAFSPLTYTSTITLLPFETPSPNATSQEEHPTMQQHLINASHPSGLFSARLSMTVDSLTLCVSSLDILKLDPAAERELGSFMRGKSREDGVLSRDIGVICWAMGRWVETSILRARFWCAIDHEFSTVEARTKSLQQKMKRKAARVVTADDDTVPLDAYEGDEESSKHKWSQRQLLPRMGHSAMEVAADHVELRFEWRIGFDWTGEVESLISASARLPMSWQKSDDRKSLSKVPESFDRLVKQKGPYAAVRTIVGLLMPVS